MGLLSWCAREDLNLHLLRDQILSLACLPFHHSRSAAKMLLSSINLKLEQLRVKPGNCWHAYF